jgi:hypothetical protein
MREEAHGEHFLTVIMDGGNQTKIVGDVKNGYRAIAFDRNLIGVGKSLTGFTQILPTGCFGYPVPVVKRGTSFGVSPFGRIEKFSGDDPHTVLSNVAKMTTFVKTSFCVALNHAPTRTAPPWSRSPDWLRFWVVASR